MLAVPAAARRSPLALLAERLDRSSERAREAAERDSAYADVQSFARNAWIQTEAGDAVKFGDIGWAWQFQLLALWAVTKLSVVLKARQLGVSWLAAIYALWSAIRRPGQNVLLISKGQDDADKLLAKVAFVYERLPAWKPYAVVNVKSIRFPDLGSEIASLPATDGVGRSRTATLVILDEWAWQPNARKIFLAIKGAADKGQIIGLSTANGLGALHTAIYKLAAAGKNAWKAIFVPSRARPDRQGDWRDRARAEWPLSEAEFNQEYPENAIDAFIATGNPIFDHVRLAEQEIRIGARIPAIAGATVFEAPVAGAVYAIAADPAEGLAESDWSSAAVLRIEQHEEAGYRGDQVAQLRGKWAPEVFARKLDELATFYGQHPTPANPTPVLLAWERNNHGHAVRVALEDIEARRKTPARYAMFRAKDKRRGWLQTTEARAVLVDQLAMAVRTSALELHDAGTIDQFSTFHENERGKAEAQEGFHDDDVIAVGIAWQLRRRLFGRVLELPVREPKVAA